MAYYFFAGGGFAITAAAAFLRVVWRDYNMLKVKVEDKPDECMVEMVPMSPQV